jgi:hypothetical protein
MPSLSVHKARRKSFRGPFRSNLEPATHFPKAAGRSGVQQAGWDRADVSTAQIAACFLERNLPGMPAAAHDSVTASLQKYSFSKLYRLTEPLAPSAGDSDVTQGQDSFPWTWVHSRCSLNIAAARGDRPVYVCPHSLCI